MANNLLINNNAVRNAVFNTNAQQQKKPALTATAPSKEAAANTARQREANARGRKENTVRQVKNTAAQIGRVPGGIAQGALKTAMAPDLLKEGFRDNINARNANRLGVVNQERVAAGEKPIGAASRETFNPTASAGLPSTPDGNKNIWTAPNAMGNASANIAFNEPTARAVTSNANTAIENWTNSWVPTPTNPAAALVAKGADALGEAIPTAVIALATGGGSASSIFSGTALSRLAGSANAFSTEMVEGSGDLGRAVLSGGVEYLSEYIGGKTFDKAADVLSGGSAIQKVAGKTLNVVGEGLEENISGAIYGTVTGDGYTLSDAREDFVVGSLVGSAMQGGISAANTVSSAVTEGRVQKAVNARVAAAASSDINDIKSLISHSGESAANAVIAQDSLTAIQKQSANPVNTVQETSAIPTDIAEKYGLTPISDKASGKPLTITTRSYEGIVSPEVSALSTNIVPISDRAHINPNEATIDNPRALYQYAQDIYLRPGTDVSGSTFTYRGQANQFFRGSQEAGSIPASGAGTSWEGSGVYSSPTPYTTDLYGPSGKLADNPYSNRGIPQRAVDVDYPIGVILQQSTNMNETNSPLTRTDAPNDIVPEGTRRIRYDDKGRGLVTEVVNNPSDISAVGLIFNRSGVNESTPIQYATNDTSTSRLQTGQAPAIAQTDSHNQLRGNTQSEESAYGVYAIPEIISTNALEVAIARSEGGEDNSASYTQTVNQANAYEGVASQQVTAEQKMFSMRTAEGAITSHSIPITPSRRSETGIPENGLPINTNTAAATESHQTAGLDSEQDISQEQNNALESKDSDQAETSKRIWTPTQVPQDSNNRRRKEKKDTRYDAGLFRGSGATGRIHETDRYNTTFGALSSY